MSTSKGLYLSDLPRILESHVDFESLSRRCEQKYIKRHSGAGVLIILTIRSSQYFNSGVFYRLSLMLVVLFSNWSFGLIV